MKKGAIAVLLIVLFICRANAESNSATWRSKMFLSGDINSTYTLLSPEAAVVLNDPVIKPDTIISAEAVSRLPDIAKLVKRTDMLAESKNYKIANELIKRGRFQDAIDTLSKISKNTTYILADYAQFRLANTLDLLGSKNIAEQEYLKLIEDFKNSIFIGKAYYKLGEIYVGKKEYLKAAEFFDKAAQIKSPITPKDRAIFRAGACYEHLGAVDKAAARYLDVCSYNPPSSFQKEAKEKLKTLNFELAKINNGSSEAAAGAEAEEDLRYKAARYYRSQGFDPLAKEAYYELIKKYPDTDAGISAAWELGFWFYESENYKEAYNVFGSITENKEAAMLAKCQYWRAKSAEKLGRYDEAKEILSEVAGDYSGTYYGRRARDRAKLPVSYSPYIASMPTIEADLISGEAHFYKYRELLNANLYDDAANEARLIMLEQNNVEAGIRANICLAFALHAEKKYHEAIYAIERSLAKMLGEEEPEFSKKISLCISYPKAFEEEVFAYSKKYGIDPYLVFALIREESRFDPFAVSRSRARGLTQIMPRTGLGIAKQLSLYNYQTTKLFDPGLNIRMGAYYLSKLLKVFGGNKHLALASYNGGPSNVTKWLKKIKYTDIDEFVENIPFKETRLYVKKVLGSYWQYKKLYEGG